MNLNRTEITTYQCVVIYRISITTDRNGLARLIRYDNPILKQIYELIFTMSEAIEF